MNRVLLDILWGRSRQRYYQSLETRVSSIEQYLPKVANVKQEPLLHVENILLETFRHASIAAYQAEDEVNNTFNYYIILAGIVAVGLPTIQGLIFQAGEHGVLSVIFSYAAGIILFLIFVLSIYFLERFLQLAKERYDNIKTMTNIQDFYTKNLATQMPDIDEIFSKQRGSEKGFSVPRVILFCVLTVGSLCFGGAVSIFSPTLFSAYILSALGFFVLGFGGAIAFYIAYYRYRLSKMKK